MSKENVKRLSKSTIMGSGVSGIGNTIGGDLFYSWFLFFLTSVAGVAPAAAGSISLVAVLWDAINDPLIGSWCDNNRSKGGRRRFFMITGAVPVSIILILLFTNVNLSGGAKVVYFMLMNVLFWFAFTWTDVPTLALVDNLDGSYDEKTKAKTSWTFFLKAGSIFSVSIPPIMIAAFESKGLATDKAWTMMAVIMGIAMFLAYFITWMSTRGKEIMPVRTEKTKSKFLKQYVDAFKNKAMRNSMFGVIFLYLGFNGVAIPTMAYILNYNLRLNAGTVSAFMMCYTVAGVVGSLVLGMISSKYGQKIGSKAKQLAIPSMIYGIIAVVGILAGSKRTVVLLVMIALGFCCSAFHLHGWNLGLDAAKIDEYKTGEDKGCSYVAFIGFAFKVGGAVGMWLIGFILQCFGFNSELASQSSNALVGIQICFYVIAGIFMIIGAIVLFRNPLTREKLDAIMDGIERKRQGLPVDESKFSDLL